MYTLLFRNHNCTVSQVYFGLKSVHSLWCTLDCLDYSRCTTAVRVYLTLSYTRTGFCSGIISVFTIPILYNSLPLQKRNNHFLFRISLLYEFFPLYKKNAHFLVPFFWIFFSLRRTIGQFLCIRLFWKFFAFYKNIVCLGPFS